MDQQVKSQIKKWNLRSKVICYVNEIVRKSYERSTDQKLKFNRSKVRSTDQMLDQKLEAI